MRNSTLIFGGVALAGAAGLMVIRFENAQQRLHVQLTESLAKSRALETSLASAQTNAATLTAHLHQIDAELGSTKSALNAAELSVQNQQAALELAQAETRAALAAAEQARAAQQAAQSELIQTRDLLAGSISPAQAKRDREIIAELESQVGELENEVVQAKTHPAPTFVASRAYHAQIVAVGPRNAFVVINYGNTHAARFNQRFEVKRGLDVLATVEISDITDNYSVAQVVPETLSGNLRKGDAAIIIP